MSAEAVFHQRLVSDTTLSQLVGGRVHAVKHPHNPVYPMIVWRRISQVHDHTLEGYSGYAQGRFQLDCYGKEEHGYEAISTIASAAVEALEKVRDGRLLCKLVGAYDLDDDSAEPKLLLKTLDFETAEAKG